MTPLAAAPHAADFTARRRAEPGAPSSPAAARWMLALIVLLAVALRALSWQGSLQLAADGPDFLWQAERLQSGDVAAALSHPYPPLYAMSIATLARLTHDLALSGALISMLAGVLIVLTVHALARLALPDRRDVACAAALLAALFQHGLLVTSNVNADGLFLALFLIAMLLVFDAEQSGTLRLRLFGAGLFLGLAWLTRAEGAVLLLPVLLWFVAGLVRRESRRHRPLPPRGVYVGATLLCLLGLLLFVGPYVFLVHDVSGNWAPGVADVGGLRPVAIAAPADSPLGSPRVGIVRDADLAPASWMPPEAQHIALALGREPAIADAAAGATGVTASTTPATPVSPATLTTSTRPAPPAGKPPRPSRPIQRIIQNVQLFGVSFTEAAALLGRELRLDLLFLAALGLPVLVRRRAGLLTMLVLLTGGWLAIAAGLLMTRGSLGPRDLLGPALLVLPVAGAGLAWLWGSARAYPRRPWLAVWAGRLPALLLVAALIGLSLSSALAPPPGAAARKAALSWVAQHSAPGERIAGSERRDAWTAQRPLLAVGLPADTDELFAQMQRHDVRLLVLPLDALQRNAPEWLASAALVERARFGEGAETVVVLERQRVTG